MRPTKTTEDHRGPPKIRKDHSLESGGDCCKPAETRRDHGKQAETTEVDRTPTDTSRQRQLKTETYRDDLKPNRDNWRLADDLYTETTKGWERLTDTTSHQQIPLKTNINTW